LSWSLSPSIGTMSLSHDNREPANNHPFLRAKLVLKVVLRVDQNHMGCLLSLAM
jgi:hypothetical protein